MADFDQTWNSNSSYNIPAYAINVQVEVAGARGGNGGNDSAPGGTGGNGRKAILYLPNFIGRTLSWTLGSRGGDGFGCGAAVRVRDVQLYFINRPGLQVENTAGELFVDA